MTGEPEPERTPTPPIAVLHGRRDLDVLGWGFVLLPGVAAAGLWAISTVPEAQANAPPLLLSLLASPCTLALVAVPFVAALVALMRFMAIRVGATEVHADRAIVLRMRAWTVFFDDVVAFDDRSADVVGLRLARAVDGGPIDAWSWLPSARGDRSALLDALEARGVPRIDPDAGRPPRALPPPPATLLVAADAPIFEASVLVKGSDAVRTKADLRAALRGIASLRRAVWLLEDRVRFAGWSEPVTVGWDDLVGWRLARGGVALVLRSRLRRAFGDVRVPAAYPEALETLTALLRERGIPRVG